VLVDVEKYDLVMDNNAAPIVGEESDDTAE
jgi:hypothetical protein